MFDCYNIIEGADLAEDVAKRFEGKSMANKSQTMSSISNCSRPTSPLSSCVA